MAKKRVTRKQLLKEPDEFITTTGKLIAWAKANTKMLAISSVLFFVLIVILSVYGYVSENRSNTAQTMFSQAVTKYQEQKAKNSGEDALTAVSADFDALIESHGSLPAGRIGRVLFGHINMTGKSYNNAIAHYQKALEYFGSDPSLANIIRNGLGMAYQQKGEYPAAIENYRAIADGPGSMLKEAALFNLAKLYGQLGKSQESQKAYKQLSDDYPNSMYADIVREKVAG